MLTTHYRHTGTSPTTGEPDAARARLMLFVGSAAGIVTLAFAFYAKTWQSFSAVRKICPIAFCDFGDYYYPMGGAVFRSGLPLAGFLYSPFVAILLALFSPLGLKASLVLWGILQALFISLYVHLFGRLVAAGLRIQLLFVALILTSYPLLLNLMAGQMSVFIMVALLGTLALYQRGRRAGAAGVLALAVSVKFYPIVFLAPFAARRDARFLLVAIAACGAFLFMVPGLLLGGSDTLRFYGALVDAFRDSDWVAADPHSQFFPHVVLRAAAALAIDASAHYALLTWVSTGVAVANMGLVFLVQRARLRHADLWSFQIVCLTIPFILKTSWPHDFVFLPFTQTFMAWRLLDREGTAFEAASDARSSQTEASGARTPDAHEGVTSALLVASILFSSIVFYNLVGSFEPYGHLAILFWADLFLLIASYRMLLPAASRQLAGGLRQVALA